MADILITQLEADTLLDMEKFRVDEQTWDVEIGRRLHIPLVSADRRESFLLDISRSAHISLKGKYQNRARQSIILVRYDFGGAPHRNPDNELIVSPHIHMYREGFGDKWARPVTADEFQDLNDPWQVINDFMRYCHIIQPPYIQMGLFT